MNFSSAMRGIHYWSFDEYDAKPHGQSVQLRKDFKYR